MNSRPPGRSSAATTCAHRSMSGSQHSAPIPVYTRSNRPVPSGVDRHRTVRSRHTRSSCRNRQRVALPPQAPVRRSRDPRRCGHRASRATACQCRCDTADAPRRDRRCCRGAQDRNPPRWRDVQDRSGTAQGHRRLRDAQPGCSSSPGSLLCTHPRNHRPTAPARPAQITRSGTVTRAGAGVSRSRVVPYSLAVFFDPGVGSQGSRVASRARAWACSMCSWRWWVVQ